MQLDLNLLRALDALLEECSVGGAADRLHLSQPAMSRTLGRIRAATGDPIMVRAGREMLLTPYAESVRGRVHDLLEQSRSLLSPVRDFEPARLEATFTVRSHDVVTDALAPRLVGRLQELAPGVRLRFLAEPGADDGALRTGATDLEIDAEPPASPDVHARVVASERLAVAMRAGHPLAGRALTMRRYVDAVHVTISRRGRLESGIDALLAERGHTRRVIASAPTSAAALRIAQETDALVAVAEAMTEVAARGLLSVPLPFEAPAVPAIMKWHARTENDPAHRWLRDLVTELFANHAPGA